MRCDIADEGLECLKGMSSLISLDVSYCRKITDKGLEHIKHMCHLTSLDLGDCVDRTITESGWKGLVEKLPRLIIAASGRRLF